jgi:tRNA U34 5-carboxymethylaminomethyl modifying GTPase MnmE/TrmE
MANSISTANTELIGAQQAIDAARAALPKAAPADANSLRNTINQLEEAMNQVKSSLDFPGDMTQQDGVQLQTLMDRRLQLEEVWSNIMKKIGDTDEGITQNIK